MLMKRRLLALACLLTLVSACSTNYYTYSGSGVYQGRGGASKNVDGVDIWLVGTPPRKFKIIGYITDSRHQGVISMALRDSALASVAKKNGGDGILIQGDQREFLGTVSTGYANAVTNGSGTAVTSGNVTTFSGNAVTTATGTGVAMPIIRRESQYFVIKYVE